MKEKFPSTFGGTTEQPRTRSIYFLYATVQFILKAGFRVVSFLCVVIVGMHTLNTYKTDLTWLENGAVVTVKLSSTVSEAAAKVRSWTNTWMEHDSPALSGSATLRESEAIRFPFYLNQNLQTIKSVRQLVDERVSKSLYRSSEPVSYTLTVDLVGKSGSRQFSTSSSGSSLAGPGTWGRDAQIEYDNTVDSGISDGAKRVTNEMQSADSQHRSEISYADVYPSNARRLMAPSHNESIWDDGTDTTPLPDAPARSVKDWASKEDMCRDTRDTCNFGVCVDSDATAIGQADSCQRKSASIMEPTDHQNVRDLRTVDGQQREKLQQFSISFYMSSRPAVEVERGDGENIELQRQEKTLALNWFEHFVRNVCSIGSSVSSRDSEGTAGWQNARHVTGDGVLANSTESDDSYVNREITVQRVTVTHGSTFQSGNFQEADGFGKTRDCNLCASRISSSFEVGHSNGANTSAVTNAHNATISQCALVVSVHGGGWVTLNNRVYDKLFRRQVNSLNSSMRSGAARTQRQSQSRNRSAENEEVDTDDLRRGNKSVHCVVLAAIEYSLAPENPFPAGLNDVTTALQWMWDYAEHLGIDRTRISLIGDSAGGNLVAAALGEALNATSHNPDIHTDGTAHTPSNISQSSSYHGSGYHGGATKGRFDWIRGVVSAGLIYPSLCRTCATWSAIEYGDLFTVNLKSSIWFDLMYTSSVKLHRYRNDWRVSPYLIPEHLLRRWPPTYIVLFKHDIAHDIGLLFHEKLRRSGVFTALYVRPGLHGAYGSDTFNQYGVESLEWMSRRVAESLAKTQLSEPDAQISVPTGEAQIYSV